MPPEGDGDIACRQGGKAECMITNTSVGSSTWRR
jgi:hypothetical protein